MGFEYDMDAVSAMTRLLKLGSQLSLLTGEKEVCGQLDVVGATDQFSADFSYR